MPTFLQLCLVAILFFVFWWLAGLLATGILVRAGKLRREVGKGTYDADYQERCLTTFWGFGSLICVILYFIFRRPVSWLWKYFVALALFCHRGFRSR